MTIHWPAPATAKYHARSVVLDGRRFASQHEADRYSELVLLARAGQVRNLRCQVPFPLLAARQAAGDRPVAHYVADFVYNEAPDWRRVVEDAKGVRTAVYKLKKRWFETQYGQAIREVLTHGQADRRRPPRRPRAARGARPALLVARP